MSEQIDIQGHKIGDRVIIRDTVGSSTEGTLAGNRSDHGIDYVVLMESRQINWQNVETDPVEVEAWGIPGENWIARHLIVGIHPTHLGEQTKAKKGRRK